MRGEGRELGRLSGSQFAKLNAFVAVADRGSFTKAAASLGMATPSLSLAIRSLEEELGVRLLNRTTRSVALTEAGERLLGELHPLMDAFDRAVDGVKALSGKPVGTLRLAVSRMAALTVVSPLIVGFQAEYPGIDIEISVDNSHVDIVGDRFDAGIRGGGRIEQDMIAVRIGDDFKMVAAATPGYLARHPAVSVPEDLIEHNCIRYRMDWDGTIRPWIFERAGQRIEAAVHGSLVVNDLPVVLDALLGGLGVAYLPKQWIARHIEERRLVVLLEDWAPSLSGLCLYYSDRRQVPPKLKALIDFVRRHRKEAQPFQLSAGSGSQVRDLPDGRLTP